MGINYRNPKDLLFGIRTIAYIYTNIYIYLCEKPQKQHILVANGVIVGMVTINCFHGDH